MKTLTSKILLGVFSLGFTLNSVGEEYIPIIIVFESDSIKFAKPIILNKGDSVKFFNVMRTNGNVDGRIKAKITVTTNGQEYSKEITKQITGDYEDSTFWEFSGPLKVEFGARGHIGGVWLVATALVTRAHEQKGSNVSGYSLVLPEGEGGKQKLVLESSTDLVSWTEDSLGSKDSSDKKRFYRLRAVKE